MSLILSPFWLFRFLIWHLSEPFLGAGSTEWFAGAVFAFSWDLGVSVSENTKRCGFKIRCPGDKHRHPHSFATEQGSQIHDVTHKGGTFHLKTWFYIKDEEVLTTREHLAEESQLRPYKRVNNPDEPVGENPDYIKEGLDQLDFAF